MQEIEDLLINIDTLREQLEYLINEKQGNLLDQEVVVASKAFNDAVNEYNKLIDKNRNEL